MAAYTSPPLSLIGRDRELDTLRERLAAALAGRGSLALIGGEAGIGKTTLAEALCREATEQGALVLVGRCYDLTETPPYGPFLELFRGYRRDNDLPPAPFSQWPGAGDVGSREAIYERILGFFGEVARQRPLVLFLDDLHWADHASLDLLRVLARALPAWPVLVLATYRADELTRHHPLYTLLPSLEREAPVMHVSPRPLDGEAIAALVRHRYPLPDGDAERLVAYLEGRAEGNPLFVAQLLRALEERDILRRDGRGWQLDDLSGLGVPASLMQLIDARLARLDEGTRALLGMAAVVGQEVTLRLWAAATGAGDDAVILAAEAASAIGLVEVSGDGDRARFVHALIRECVYEGIFPPRRRTLHRRVAEVLAAVPAADPDTVAYHFEQGGDPRAIGWLVQAGERARHAHADDVATDRMERALFLMEAGGQSRTEEGCWLLLRLGHAYRFLSPERSVAFLEDARRVADSLDSPILAAVSEYLLGVARVHSPDLAAAVREMRAGLGALEALPAAEQSRVRDMLALGMEYARGLLVLHTALTGHFGDALALSSGKVSQPRASSQRHLGRMYAYAGLGDPDAALVAFAHAADIDRSMASFRQLAVDCLFCLTCVALPYRTDDRAMHERLATEGAHAWSQAGRVEGDRQPPQLGWLPVLLLAGRWDEFADFAPALRITNSQYRALIGHVLGPFAHLRGDAAEAWRWVREILPDGAATAPGGTHFFVGQQMQRLAATLSLDAGDVATAGEWLRAHDRWLAWSGASLNRSEGEALWAAYHRAAGDDRRACDHATRALTSAAAPQQPLALLTARRLLGTLATANGQFDVAATHLAAALALADACAAPYERALTLLARAELRTATGQRNEALAVLDDARVVFARLRAEPAIGRANAVAERLQASPPPPVPAYPAGLSAREVEVLRHLAAGHTNRAIAAALSVSEHTVRAHLRHIFAKTDSDNRAAAVAFALRHDLA